MIIPVVFLNMFFVPVISLWHYYDIGKQLDIKISLKLICQYVLFVVCNILLTRLGIFLIKIILNREILVDSGYYTLLAVISAYILLYLFKIAREIKKRNFTQNN